MSEPQRIEIGAVTSVNPARRELRVTALPPHEHQLNGIEWIRLAPRGAAETRLRVAAVEPVGGGAVVRLVAGVLRETVSRLKGASVVILPEEVRLRPEEDRTAADLIGFAVVDLAGETLGAVTDVFPTPAHDVLEITRAGGRTVLVPAIEEVMADIDWEGRRLVVNDLAPYGVEDAH